MAATLGEMFPPKPTFTEADIPDQSRRVFIVTGGSSGIGYEVAKALYHLNGRVYMASRSEATAQAAISSIRASSPAPKQLVKSGKGIGRRILFKEQRLDIVFHNAGVMLPGDNKPTAQGHHAQLGVNALGPFLFQHFLTPICLTTAALSSVAANSTRVIFVSSSGHRASPKPDGVLWDDIELRDATGLHGNVLKYAQSKAMNVMHAHEFARQYGKGSHGPISFSLHPGALSTNLQANAPGWYNTLFSGLRYHPHFGALTELFAGLVPLQPGQEMMIGDGDGKGKNGGYILPWGRFGEGSKYVFEGLKERGTGEKLWRVCEKMVKEYM